MGGSVGCLMTSQPRNDVTAPVMFYAKEYQREEPVKQFNIMDPTTHGEMVVPRSRLIPRVDT